MRGLRRMRRRRAVRMGVAVILVVIVAMMMAVGVGMNHRKMLYYNITEVHAGVARFRDLAACLPEF